MKLYIYFNDEVIYTSIHPQIILDLGREDAHPLPPELLNDYMNHVDDKNSITKHFSGFAAFIMIDYYCPDNVYFNHYSVIELENLSSTINLTLEKIFRN